MWVPRPRATEAGHPAYPPHKTRLAALGRSYLPESCWYRLTLGLRGMLTVVPAPFAGLRRPARSCYIWCSRIIRCEGLVELVEIRRGGNISRATAESGGPLTFRGSVARCWRSWRKPTSWTFEFSSETFRGRETRMASWIRLGVSAGFLWPWKLEVEAEFFRIMSAAQYHCMILYVFRLGN